MSWFKRVKDNIRTKTEDKHNTPEGLWKNCPNCKKALQTKGLKGNFYVCMHCDHHLKIGSEEYFEILFDEGVFSEIAENLVSADPLSFEDTKAYTTRIQKTHQKTGLPDAVRIGTGNLHGMPITVAVMDFRFIGGSMGSVVGE